MYATLLFLLSKLSTEKQVGYSPTMINMRKRQSCTIACYNNKLINPGDLDYFSALILFETDFETDYLLWAAELG